MKQYIQIAANNIKLLRKCDVFRILDTYHDIPQFNDLCAYIVDNRPDLTLEVENCLAELG